MIVFKIYITIFLVFLLYQA